MSLGLLYVTSLPSNLAVFGYSYDDLSDKYYHSHFDFDHGDILVHYGSYEMEGKVGFYDENLEYDGY